MAPRTLLEIRYAHDTVTEISNRYLRAFDAAGYHCETVILKGTRQPEAELGTAARQVHWLGFDSASLRGSRRDAVRLVAGLCTDIRPDLLLAHRFKAIAVMAETCRAYQPRAAFGVIHGMQQLQGVRRRLYARWHLRDPIHLIGVSQAVTDDLARACGRRKRLIHALPNCVDVEAIRNTLQSRQAARVELKLPPAAPVVGHIGRLVSSKDQLTLIAAFGKVRERLPQARLVLIGDGPLHARLQTRVGELGIGPSVHFVGHIDSAYRLLPAFDLFAMTSHTEGFGLAVAEAMAAGVPVVGTDAGGIGQVIGSTGPICQPGNAVQIAAAIERILALDEAALRSVRAAMLERVQSEFSVSVFNQRLHRLVDQALTEAPRSRP